ncbi:2-aminoethanethiol dioxygenase-like isoform X2 [Macrobrachium nipponense]|uniref:2-aminoethanethiol dioxygenase-like isoform X2 n=1 Tax=Macrobrachium nipponense TaxID=159736 RepID=UPI0030C8AAEC
MTSLIQQIGRLAIRTFKRDSQVPEAVFNSRYEQLYNLVNRVTPEDINLDHRLLSDRGQFNVIHGSVSVQSYSHTNTESLEEKLQEILNTRPSAGVCPATKHQKVLVTASDQACRLTPNSQNIHEIHSVDGPAAFLDILSPPYGTDKRLGVERDCHYYQEVESFNVPYLSVGSLTFLVSIPSPTDFWCDQAEYTGSIIDRNAIEENGS